MFDIQEVGRRGKKSAKTLSILSTGKKNRMLQAIAAGLIEDKAAILEANMVDLDKAEANNLSPALQERLLLHEERLEALAQAVRDVAKLPDPVGVFDTGFTRPNGLEILQKRVPFGLIGIIYESRPNVTVDTAVLCLKSGNVPILRGGKEAFSSNKALVDSMRRSLDESGFDPEYVLFVEDTSHDTALEMTQMHGIIDLLIPRGGKNLISMVVNNAKVPVIETGLGNCHLYVEKTADLEMALNILENGKCSRPSVCNALETLLVDREIADDFLPQAKKRLDAYSVEWRCCNESAAILGGIGTATEEDYATEYNDFILAVRVVGGLDEALEHIDRYSTNHSECIVTTSLTAARRFQNEVDSCAVYVNASTRFTDGGEFGFGAEVGISTQKLHARGPVGLSHLTTSKYLITGEGQIR